MPAFTPPSAETTSYKAARRYLRSGDLMVLRAGGSIPWAGRSTASHVGMLVWRRADQHSLSVAETRWRTGGRIVSLSSQVRAFPGQIDVYTPTDDCPAELRERAATVSYNWAGYAYNAPGIVRAALLHAPLLRLAAERLGLLVDPTDMTLSAWESPKFCSQLFAWAYRWARQELFEERSQRHLEPAAPADVYRELGWDACPFLGDPFVEPGDLLRSAAFRLVARGLVIA